MGTSRKLKRELIRRAMQPPPVPVAQEYRLPITKQQARLYAEALQGVALAQDRANAIASTLLASRSIEEAQNVRLDLTDRRRPALLYLVLPEDERPPKPPLTARPALVGEAKAGEEK